MKDKELAELLGISAKYTHDQFVRPMFYDFDYTQQYHVNHYDWYAAYPDFTDPENFVKLLELFINEVGSLKMHKSSGEGFIESGIISLALFLSKDYNKYETDNIKHAAQQVKWRY